MNQEQLNSLIEIANKHVERMGFARDKLRHLLPFTKEKVEMLSTDEVVLIDFFINRFAKLQDLMRRKLFDLFFLVNEEEEDPYSWTIIDKLNRLERLRIINDVQIWKQMRKLRNYLSHEYPDRPDLTADNLNAIFTIAPELLLILNNLIARL